MWHPLNGYLREVGLTAEQRAGWDRDGFFILPGFAERPVLDAMVDRIVELAQLLEQPDRRPDLIATPEKVLDGQIDPERRLSKIFRLMRTEPVFRDFATDSRLLPILADLIGPDVACFLSQFIFKNPGALGQPWHQDNYYFRMRPLPQVALWLACSASTLDNGPLWVVPGSHNEAIHDAEPDTREDAGLFYVEITTADTRSEQVVLMDPGDLLVFHSHLRHRSTDNRSDDRRAAMVYHYAHPDSTGPFTFNQDWVDVLRDGVPVTASTDPVPVRASPPG